MSTGEPYRPSNATEFDWFYARTCQHCTRDDAKVEKLCPLIAQAFANEGTPLQWIVDPRLGQICTGFTEDPEQPARCLETGDLFAATRKE